MTAHTGSPTGHTRINPFTSPSATTANLDSTDMTTTLTRPATPAPRRPTRPRRGRSTSLANGLRHDHTVTCTLAGTPNGCDCPYSFWHPRQHPRRRVRVAGTQHDALQLRRHMQHEASGTIHMASLAPRTGPAASVRHSPALVAAAPTQHTPTFGEWAQQVMTTVWLRHSANTRQARTSVYRNHIAPDLADLDLADVNAQAIEAWLAELTRRDVSLHMQRQAYDVVRTITGNWYEQLGQPNPVATVKRPITPPAQEKRAKDSTITLAQYQQLLAACETVSEELMIRVATEAGLRIGEIAGLQRRDIDLTARTITVKRQGNRNTTKTGQRRVIHIVTDELANAFRRHLTDMDAAGSTTPDAYIWRGGHSYEESVNKPYERQGIYRIIRRILTRVGLENVTRPHGLRATGAQLLIEAGASMKLVSQHLGHATQRTTEDYYVGDVNTDRLASYGEAFG